MLDQYLRLLNKKINPVEKNGLCILHSVQEVLCGKNIVPTIDELKATLKMK